MRERVDLKSPVREYRPPGSVRGAPGNRCPYLDSEGRSGRERAKPKAEISTEDNGGNEGDTNSAAAAITVEV